MSKFNKKRIAIIGVMVISLLGYFVFSDFASAQQFSPGNIGAPGSGVPGGGDFGRATAGRAGAAGAIGGAALGFLERVGTTAEYGLIIYGLLQILYHVLFWFVTFAYGLLNSTVSMALNPYWFQIPAVLIAWQLVRDFVNVWFILIFLFIAIGTILRTSSFQAKKLLPIMVLVALFVNFSMPVSKFVIDAANIVSFQFLKSICQEKVDPKSGLKTCDVSASLENALDTKIFTQALKKLSEKPQEQGQNPQENPKVPLNNQLVPKAQAFVPIAIGGAVFSYYVLTQVIIGTISLLVAGWGAIQTYLGNSSILGVATQNFIGILVSDVFLLVTAYVILSLAILFIIRIVTLLFIVIISPLGFVMTALPGTQNYGKMWWDKLLTQSFFAPFSLFFLWISITLMSGFKLAMETPQIAPYADYDVSNPANIRLIFYIFSLILLYASLWIARKMGAIGSDTLMKWFGTAMGAITGFVGGFAARQVGKAFAPLGAGLTAAGLPEAVGKKWWLGGALGGIRTKEFAEWLSKRGKAPEEAAAKAELGMRLAPVERAAYFATLDRAAKEAMLRKMKAEEREQMLAGLGAAEQTAARQILRSAAFAPEERASAEVEEFQRKWQGSNQWKNFGSLSEEAQQNFLLRFTDDGRRAEFLQKVKEEGNPTAAQNANDFIEKNARFTANQQFDHMKARWKQELIAAQKADRIPEFMADIMKGAATDEEIKKASDLQKNYFKFGMDDRQRLDLLEESYGNKKEIAKIGEWVLDLRPEEQNKFYRETLGKLASPEAVVAFISAVSTGDRVKDLPTQKRILSAASPQQLGRVASESSLLRPLADQIAMDTMSLQNQNLYERNRDAGPRGGRGGGKGTPWSGGGSGAPVGPAPIAPFAPAAPVDTAVSPTTSSAMALNAEINRINSLDLETKREEIKEAIENLSKEPQFEKLRRKINILIDYEFIEQGVKSPRKLIEFLQKTIPELSPTEIFYKIDAKTLANSGVRYHVLKKVNSEQLTRLVLDPERAKIIKDHLHNPGYFYESHKPGGDSVVERVIKEQNTTSSGARNIILKDPELYSEAIAEMFEQEYKNANLAKTLSRVAKTLKENLTNYGDKIIKERLFE